MKYEQKAVDLAPHITEMKENLEKMREGKKTWPEKK
jgi:hypothetical protein